MSSLLTGGGGGSDRVVCDDIPKPPSHNTATPGELRRRHHHRHERVHLRAGYVKVAYDSIVRRTRARLSMIPPTHGTCGLGLHYS